MEDDTLADYAVLLLSDSPLAGSEELAFGLRSLQRKWPGSVLQHPRWFVYPSASAPSPAELAARLRTRYLLVLLEPALLGTATLPRELAEALQTSGSVCALADDARFAQGEWAPGYATLIDFERYVARRRALPLSLAQDCPVRGNPAQGQQAQCDPTNGERVQAGVKAYMLRLDRLRAWPGLAHGAWAKVAIELGHGPWAQLPFALGQATVLAPRAFVHSYADYQQGARPEMLELLPVRVKRLLDVGGGEGGFARAFALLRQGRAVLVEPGPRAAQQARACGLQVIEGGIESVSATEHGLFDAVSFLDVLEHLVDPLAALHSARQLLAPGGVLLLSVPNLGYWPVLRDLMAGRFDYQPVGILCNTHLRFFTARSLELLLQEAGFELVRLRRQSPAMDDEFERFVQAATAAGVTCDRDNLATESLHALACAR